MLWYILQEKLSRGHCILFTHINKSNVVFLIYVAMQCLQVFSLLDSGNRYPNNCMFQGPLSCYNNNQKINHMPCSAYYNNIQKIDYNYMTCKEIKPLYKWFANVSSVWKNIENCLIISSNVWIDWLLFLSNMGTATKFL